jgi:hypothetical protein
MVGPLRHLHGINGRTLFCILLVGSLILVMIILLPGSKPTLTSKSVPSLQPRPQPNYLEHPQEGQAYMHTLLVQSGGDFDRLNAGNQAFVDGVLGGHARRYFPLMYREMTSKARGGAAASSTHERSSDTN